jgi:phosphoglycolate phosphatase-like HAD superfamily hydrolase
MLPSNSCILNGYGISKVSLFFFSSDNNIKTQKKSLTLNKSILIGDRWRDIHAGQAAGCKSYLIDNNYDEPKPNPPYETVTSVLHLVMKLEAL